MKLHTRRTLNYMDTNHRLKYRQKVTANIEIIIWHGRNLIIRDVQRNVVERAIDHMIISGPFFEAIGFCNQYRLSDTCDNYGGIFNVS